MTTIAAALAPLVLPDADGTAVRLGALWEEMPAVLVFLRHYGCIFCREHVAQLRDHAEELRALGANVAAVGVGGGFQARDFGDRAGIDFPLLVDERLEAYAAAGLEKGKLWWALSPGNTLRRFQALASGHRDGQAGREPMQLGGSFVLAPGDVDVFVHRARGFADNAAISVLVDAVRAWRPAA